MFKIVNIWNSLLNLVIVVANVKRLKKNLIIIGKIKKLNYR